MINGVDGQDRDVVSRGALRDRAGNAPVAPVDDQNAGQLQLVDLFRQEEDGLEAGFGLRGAPDERCVILQTVILRQIAEGKAVCKKQGVPHGIFRQICIRRIQRGELFGVSRRVRSIGVRVFRVRFAQCPADRLADDLGVSKRQPDVFVVFGGFRRIGRRARVFGLLILHALDELLLADCVAEDFDQI